MKGATSLALAFALTLLISPAIAGDSFYALSTMPAATRVKLVPLPDAQLATVEGEFILATPAVWLHILRLFAGLPMADSMESRQTTNAKPQENTQQVVQTQSSTGGSALTNTASVQQSSSGGTVQTNTVSQQQPNNDQQSSSGGTVQTKTVSEQQSSSGDVVQTKTVSQQQSSMGGNIQTNTVSAQQSSTGGNVQSNTASVKQSSTVSSVQRNMTNMVNVR
jgi:hypothetical protein